MWVLSVHLINVELFSVHYFLNYNLDFVIYGNVDMIPVAKFAFEEDYYNHFVVPALVAYSYKPMDYAATRTITVNNYFDL